MNPVTLKIKSGYASKTVSLEDELTIGRTGLADIQLDDSGLSRVNTTIFRDGDEVLVVDEHSTNGTFINGNRVSGGPQVLFDGDELKLGSDTRILISFQEAPTASEISKDDVQKRDSSAGSRPVIEDHKPGDVQDADPLKDSAMILWVAGGSTVLILFLAVFGFLFANWYESKGGDKPKPEIAVSNAVIPIRVIDPLGKQKQEDLDDLVQYWEVQEAEVTAEDLEVKAVGSDGSSEAEYFNVSIDFWKSQRAKALQNPVGPTGIWPAGLQVPAILRGDGVVKQKAKLREMQQGGYQIPMDFADLVQKRNQKLLVEMPMATQYWVLEVGGSSTTGPFTSFNFNEDSSSPIAQVGSPDFNLISQLAQNFSGDKYDMNNPDHRRQMKIRLLRMFNPRAKLALEELAKYFYAKFNKPLRVTSLSRSMEYQMSLNRVNPNSFKVRGAGSLPPHTSGCAFDLGRKHMGAAEQNYLMAKLEEMEKRGVLDALIEGNANACFHVFVYEDGKTPAGY